MFPSRTRKPAAPLRLAATVLALGAAAAARAGGADPTNLRVQLAPASAAAPAMLVIAGNVPARCAPSVQQATLSGTDLDVVLQPAQNACGKSQQPFLLRMDPAASVGMPELPPQVYHVRVYSAGEGARQLLAFSLGDATGASLAGAVSPENGFWWPQAGVDAAPASAGTGVSIESQGDRVAAGLFGFGDGGTPAWSFGSATLQGRIARIPLVQLADGDPLFSPNGATPTAQAGPRLELEFLSPGSARAYFVRNDGLHDTDVRAMTLARTHFAAGGAGAGWSGQWVLVPDDDGAVPRVFEFADASSQDAESFHLADAGHDAALDCRLAAGTQSPELCTLSAAAATLADFDQVGIDRLSGHSADGARVRLLRLPR